MKYNKLFKKSTKWLSSHWQNVLTTVFIAGLAITTLGLQIRSLSSGQSAIETATLAQLSTAPAPSERMVNAPYTIPAYYLGQFLEDPLYGARVVSVLYALLATIVLYFLIKRWFTSQIAIIASLLFITSSWVLAISHQAAPLILLVVAPLLLISTLARYVANKDTEYTTFILLIMSIAFSAYVPYMFWTITSLLVVLVFIYKRTYIPFNIKGIILAAVLFIVLLAPMAVSLFYFPWQIKDLLGIPMNMPTITEYLSNFVHQFTSLFLFIQPYPELFLARLPILDIFSAVMVVLGVYYFIKHMPKRRELSLFIAISVLLLVIPLSENYLLAMTALIPFVYILIPSGIFEILKQWYEIFPRNPVARNMAVIAIVIVVGLATFYNLERFYVAWPNTDATNAAYMVQSK